MDKIEAATEKLSDPGNGNDLLRRVDVIAVLQRLEDYCIEMIFDATSERDLDRQRESMANAYMLARCTVALMPPASETREKMSAAQFRRGAKTRAEKEKLP